MKEEEEEMRILVQKGFQDFDWEGERNKSPLWDDSRVILQKSVHTDDIKFISSTQSDESSFTRLTIHGQKVSESARWIDIDTFLEEFEFLTVCQTDFKESRKFRNMTCSIPKREVHICE